MQRLAAEAIQGGAQFIRSAGRIAAAGTVDGVADDRVTDMRQMHPDLVGTSGLQLRQHLGVGAEALDDPKMCHRRTPIRAHRHLGAGGTVPADRLINGAAPGEYPQAHRDVAALDFAGRQRLDQGVMGLNGAGHDHQAARILVQPMDQSGARHQGQARIESQQGILQGVPRIAGAGVHHHAGRFVDDAQRLVLIHDLHGQRLGRNRRFGLDLRLDAHLLAP